MEPACKVWGLERYARLISSQQGTGDWEYFDNKDVKLELTLTNSQQLLLHHGKKQMESLCLLDSRSRIKGLSKGDSLMIITKIKEESRRFRIKFSEECGTKGTERCRQCVETLSQYFQIKLPVYEETSSTQQSGTSLTLSGEKQMIVEEDITLGQMAEAILNSSGSSLPPLYSHPSCETSHDLDTLIKLCLTDPTFPSFVETVEKHLDKIKEECN